MRRIVKTMMKVSEKIWGGRNPNEVLTKRFKIFVLFGIFLIGISKLLYLVGITFPNLELVIPTLVVIGSFSFYSGGTKFLRGMGKYFGIIALVSVLLIDMVFWGIRSIYIFTWPGFVFCWMLGRRNRLSMFDKYKALVGHTMLTTAIAILLFDLWTGIIGSPISGLYGPITTPTPWLIAFIGQIPFTFYHLLSLLFVPPLVGLGKLLVKVKVPASVAVQLGTKTASGQRR